MTYFLKHSTLFTLLFVINMCNYSQVIFSESENYSIKQDNQLNGFESSPGGVFIAPTLGLEYPLKNFGNNSGVGLSYGAKLEFASLSIYPLVFFAEYQYQSNPGNDSYKTINLLNSLETNINSFGGGFYLLVNKYLKSNFTMPFVVGGVKYMSVKRIYSPENASLDIIPEENVVVFSAGLGFTLYIFDIIGTYNNAKDFSSVSIKTQFHFPLFKF